MEIRIKNAAGALMLLSAVPAIAQESGAAKASAVVGCASCPPVEYVVATPGGPTLLLAVFGIGILVGAGLAKLLGTKKAQ